MKIKIDIKTFKMKKNDSLDKTDCNLCCFEEGDFWCKIDDNYDCERGHIKNKSNQKRKTNFINEVYNENI